MPELKWKLRNQDELITWCRNDETVAYDAGSGDTHLFDLVAAEGLNTLLESQLTEEDFAEQLANRLDIDLDEQLRRYVGRLIKQLDAAGLLETADI